MGASRAQAGSRRSFMQITAIEAAPHDLLWSLENKIVLDVHSQVEVSFFVLLLGHADSLEHSGDFRKPLITCYLSEAGIQGGPLVVLSTGSSFQVLQRRSNDAGRKSGRDLCFATLQEFEESLRVLLLLIGCLFKDGLDLYVAFLLRLGREVGVAVTGLRFPGKSRQQVLLGLRSLQVHGV